jgi:predicted DNA-binding transcriptional regulator AlpA
MEAIRVMSDQSQKHISPEQLADREDVSIQTIYHWNKTGTGPRYMRLGRHVRYRLADVLAWEDSRAVPTTRTT